MNLLEVCKKKKRWYLVFEFVDRTVLDDLGMFPSGLDYNRVRKYLFQILRGTEFCHRHNVSDLVWLFLPSCYVLLMKHATFLDSGSILKKI